MFNKVYLGDKFINKIYLGDKLIKYNKTTEPPTNIVEIKNLVLLVTGVNTLCYTDIKSLKVIKQDDSLVTSNDIWGMGGRKGIGLINEKILTNGNAGTSFINGSSTFFTNTKSEKEISIIVCHFNTPYLIKNVSLELKDKNLIDFWIGSKKTQNDQETFINRYGTNGEVQWLYKIESFNELNLWTKLDIDFINQTFKISKGTELTPEQQIEYDKMQIEKLVTTIPNFK